MAPKQPLTVGDRVRYSSAFCRLIGAATGWTPAARGEIVRLWGAAGDMAAIRWDYHPQGPGTIGHANVCNLQRLTPTGWRPRA